MKRSAGIRPVSLAKHPTLSVSQRRGDITAGREKRGAMTTLSAPPSAKRSLRTDLRLEP